MGPLGGDRVAGEQQLHRNARRDEPGQRRRPWRTAADLDLTDGEPGRVGGDAQVTALGEQEPTRVRHPVHGGDHRLGHRADLRQEFRRGDLQPGRGHLLEVAPGAERLVTGAGEHEYPGAAVLSEPAEALGQPLADGGGQGVACLRPVDRQPGDGVVDLVPDLVAHAVSPACLPGPCPPPHSPFTAPPSLVARFSLLSPGGTAPRRLALLLSPGDAAPLRLAHAHTPACAAPAPAAVSGAGSTRASSVPVSTAWPTRTFISVTTPAAGVRMVCSIFMASSTMTGAWAPIWSPGATAIRTTVPGIGASSEPVAASDPGPAKRGTSVSTLEPSGLSTYAVSPTQCTW